MSSILHSLHLHSPRMPARAAEHVPGHLAGMWQALQAFGEVRAREHLQRLARCQACPDIAQQIRRTAKAI